MNSNPSAGNKNRPPRTSPQTRPRFSPSEMLAYATIRIECDTPEGTSTGTGFYFNFVKKEIRRYRPLSPTAMLFEEAPLDDFAFT